MLINMNQMLSVAKEKHFAVGAYNVSESNLFRTVVEAAEANDAPRSSRCTPPSSPTARTISSST